MTLDKCKSPIAYTNATALLCNVQYLPMTLGKSKTHLSPTHTQQKNRAPKERGLNI